VAILILIAAIAIAVLIYKKRQENLNFSYLEEEQERSRDDINKGKYPLTDADIHECLYDPLAERQQLSAEDLLPKDISSDEFTRQFGDAQAQLKDRNFLTAGFNIGIDTSSGSRKNMSYDIRSEPKVPRFVIGPFNNSTITEDNNKRTWEISPVGC
jgi:hypothetical protein